MSRLDSTNNGFGERLHESRIKEFHYRLPWRSQGIHPGHHKGMQAGPGLDFRSYEPLLRHTDVRRLDLRLSLKNPFEMPYVRVFNQRSTVVVYTIADLSGSMGFVGGTGKLRLLAEFTASAALSAHRTGDPFGFIGCDDSVRRDLLVPASNRTGTAWALVERLRKLPALSTGAQGLREAKTYLSARRSLVFLVSDFHLPAALIAEVLMSLSRHAVVPIVVWESEEYRRLPAWGLAEARDRETGTTTTLFFRPALRRRIAEAFDEHRRALMRLFQAHGCMAYFLIDRFDPDRLTEHFLRL